MFSRVCGRVVHTFVDEEEDVFESDFESTDDEAQLVPDAGEKAVRDEERKEKKVNVFTHHCKCIFNRPDHSFPC